MKNKAMARMLNSLRYQVVAEYDSAVITESEWIKKMDGISIVAQVTEDIYWAEALSGAVY